MPGFVKLSADSSLQINVLVQNIYYEPIKLLYLAFFSDATKEMETNNVSVWQAAS